MTVVAWHVLPSQDRVALAADDLEDNDNDDLSALAGLTAQDVSPPPAPALRDIIGVTHISSWPFRYLARPQLLTRH